MFTRDNHITIPGWVMTDLQLSGNEAICYSIIFGFAQDRESEFYGSLNYLATAMGMQRQNVKRVLDRLLDKGLIVKREEWQNGIKACKYSVIELTTVLSNREQGCSQNENRGVLKMRTNNIEDNIKDNIDNIDNPPLYSPQGETPSKNFKNQAQASPNPPVPAAPLPFKSARFKELWDVICKMPKWKKKEQYALNLSLKKLSKYSEAVAIRALETAIENGWQGVFPQKAEKEIQQEPRFQPQPAPQEEKPKYRTVTMEEILGGKKK